MNQPPTPPPLTRQYTLTPYQIKCLKRKRTTEEEQCMEPQTPLLTDTESDDDTDMEITTVKPLCDLHCLYRDLDPNN